MRELYSALKEIKELLVEQQMLRKEQLILQKEYLSFKEGCLFIGVSLSYGYKLTSKRQIPHYCPSGKMLYFKRSELEQWILQYRHASKEELEQQAYDYLAKNGKKHSA